MSGSENRPPQGRPVQRRPQGTKPQGGRPQGERPARPQGARPQGPRPQGARPASAAGPRRPRPEGEMPRRPRPEGDMPRRPRPEMDEGVRRQDAPRGPRSAETLRKRSGAKTGRKAAARKNKRKKMIAIFAVELLVIALLAVALTWVLKFKKTGHQNNEGEIEFNAGTNNYFDNEKAVDSNGNATGKTLSEQYTQIALFGVDSREGQLSSKTRTDTIMIASINNDTHDVKLCSVFRDTYLNLSNDSYNKCNSAYAKGGPSQAINMLNMNLDMNIKDYMTVGFRGVVETVDAIGGVSIDITDAEIHFLNDYQYCLTEDLGYKSYTKVTSPGLQTLNGLQATAYCRIRYTAGDDFKRAERQRTVVTELTNKAKTADVGELTKIATSAFENVYTSFDLNDILDYAKNASKYSVTGSDGFPFEGHRTTGTIGSKGSCVIPTDLTTNVSLLHEFFFGVKDYDPTSTVKECSDKIKSDTSPYL